MDSTATPMAIVAEYGRATIHPNGCGGVEVGGRMFITAGGGTAGNPSELDIYSLPVDGFSPLPNPPNTPAPSLVVSRDDLGTADAHGAVLASRGRYLWVADRATNDVVVVDTAASTVAGTFTLAGTVSSDPAPDLMDIAPSGNRVFIALRGPNPLTGNVPGVNNTVGGTPGLGVVRVEQAGRAGTLQSISPISKVLDGVERADPHAVRVRPL